MSEDNHGHGVLLRPQQWEYKIIHVNYQNDDLLKIFNQEGKDNWELVTLNPDTGMGVLKRPKW